MAQRGRGTSEVNPSKSPFFQTTTQTLGVDPYSRAEWNHRQITHQQQLQQEQQHLIKYNNTNKKNHDPEAIDSKMFDFLYSRESDRIGAKPDTLNSLKNQMEADTKRQQQKSAIHQQLPHHGQHNHAHFSPTQQQLNRNQRQEEQDKEIFRQQHRQDYQSNQELEEEEENRIRQEQHMMMSQQYQQQQQQRQDVNDQEQLFQQHHPTAEEILAQYKHQPKSEHPRYLTSGNEYGRKPPTMATVVVERVPKKQDFSRSFGTMKPRNSSMNTAISKSTIHSSLDLQFL